MNNTTLLIIDDNEDSNTLVKIVLEQDTNWKVLTASNGKDGIIQARLYQPSTILLDIAMPEIDGFEVYNLLKSSPTTRFIPIIFFTAMGETEKTIERQIGQRYTAVKRRCPKGLASRRLRCPKGYRFA